jgi:hypothetical protein
VDGGTFVEQLKYRAMLKATTSAIVIEPMKMQDIPPNASALYYNSTPSAYGQFYAGAVPGQFRIVGARYLRS